LKGKTRRSLDEVIDRTVNWLEYETRDKQIKGLKTVK